MATTGPDNVKPKPEPTTKTAGGNALGLSWRFPLQAHLGRNLQDAYRPFVDEPLPGGLAKLLDALERRDKEK
jgi:hypothetical protein